MQQRSLSGTASLTLSVLNQKCCKLALNLRRCHVSAVRVNSKPCAYSILSPLDDQTFLNHISSTESRNRLADIQFSASNREEESRRCGELLISLPTHISADCLDELSRLDETAKTDPKSQSDRNADQSLQPPPVPVYHLPVLHIEVDYEVLDPNMGAIFYGSHAEDSNIRDPLYMLTDSRFGMARFWMPCVDSSHWCDRYLFDFDITVNSKFVVVASGELAESVLKQEQQVNPTKVYRYHAHAPAHASEIVVAIGAFVTIPDPTLSDTITHFCLPGHAHELIYTGPPLLAKALSYCREFFASDPPSSSFKQLFLGSSGLRPETSVVGAGGIVVHSADLLHTERCIDEGVAAREAVMSAIVMSYFGRFLRPRFAEDGWLISGLASHVTARGLESMLGANWYKYRVHDLMEELRKEPSCDLSSATIEVASGTLMESVRRRSHIILYMIERRIGRDLMVRGLRDIVAEGKRALTTLVKNIDTAVRKPVFIDEVGRTMNAPFLPDDRPLTDLHGFPCGRNAPGEVVMSGFDEAVQGVAVGPFLKRLRGLCATDLRSMVRLWASSPGIPRMQVGYQYNPRKHTIEFVVKQEASRKGGLTPPRPSLSFHGAISIRVMEAEGTYDHSLDISDHVFCIEVPCHSRRSKVVKGAGADEINTNVVTQASPLSWIRFDPENEWCLDVSFTQHESSWSSLLEGERDVIGQAQACHGLRGFTTEQSAKSLLAVLKDGQFYWRVRAEAASVLASSADGLPLLVKYFRSCYMDGESEDCGHLRPNNFSSMANYYVKRAMIRSFAEARVKGSCTMTKATGSVPTQASQFLCFILAGHDNAGNDFDDDHYVLELLNAVTDVAVNCISDEMHAAAGDGGSSTTDSIVRQLERFRSIERMIQRRTSLVASAIVKGLCRIERAKMVHEDRERGAVSVAFRKGLYSANGALFRSLYELTNRTCDSASRMTAFSCLVDTFGGDLEVASWALSFVDRTSSNDDCISLRHKMVTEIDGDDSMKLEAAQYEFAEPPHFRYRFLDALCKAALSNEWYRNKSPLLAAMRCHSKMAIDFCIRLLRLSVADGDSRVRGSALRLAKEAWGNGVPSCLLSSKEYVALREVSMERECKPFEVVAMRSHRIGLGVGQDGGGGLSSPKGTKSGKVKSLKSGKAHKGKKHGIKTIEASGALPPKAPKVGRPPPPPSSLHDVPILSSEPKTRGRNGPGGPRGVSGGRSPRHLSPGRVSPGHMSPGRISPGRPKSPLPVLTPVGSAPVAFRMPKSVPLSAAKRGVDDRGKVGGARGAGKVGESGGREKMKVSLKSFGTKYGGARNDLGKRDVDKVEMGLISEPLTQEDEVVNVGVTEVKSHSRESSRDDRSGGGKTNRGSTGKSGNPVGSSNKPGARNMSSLRSVPADRTDRDRSDRAGRPLKDLERALRWHPVDKEDREFLLKVHQESLGCGVGPERSRGSERSTGHNRSYAADESNGHSRGYERSYGDDQSGEASDERNRERGSSSKFMNGGADSIHRDEELDNGVLFVGSNGTSGGLDIEEEDKDFGIEKRVEHGNDNERKKKKKKKKKRKRDHDDEDGEPRKKKKKKKKRLGEGSSAHDTGKGEESKKIGKIQIRLPSRSTSNLSTPDTPE